MPGPGDTPGQSLPASAPPSLTYEPHYGLKEKAFSLSADPRFLYRSPAHAPAFEDLLAGIRRREGLIVLTGEIGTGKTTLIRSVLQQLDRHTFTAFVPDPFVSREDLLKMLLVDFGVVSIADLKRGSLAGASRPDLSYPLYEFLDSLVPLQAFAVLIIDEAQNLPLPLLEEIRILSELEQREKLLQVVLVGQPELKSHLKLPEMRQVDQRVSVRCELSPLRREDVVEYIRYRLRVAGGGESRVEFSDTAIDTIFSESGGVPRLINLICDRALQRGYAEGADRIETQLVNAAIRGLGLDAPSRDVRHAEAPERPAITSAAHTAAVKPAAPHAPRSSSVSVRDSALRALPPQMLSEFAAETDLAGRSGRGVSLWRLAAALLVTALMAASVAAFWYLSYMARTINVSAATLPPPPVWTAPHSIVAAPPVVDTAALDEVSGTEGFAIQVASFESRARAERLVNELTQAGFRARTVESDRGPSGPLLQIRVDGYRSVEEADRDLARIRELPGYEDARLQSN